MSIEERVKAIIIGKGGTFIKTYMKKTERNQHSTRYVMYTCQNGHLVDKQVNCMTGHTKKNQTWCRQCRKGTREKLREEGMSYGYELVSEKYIGSTSSYEWMCPNSHVFSTRIDRIRDGIACKHCRMYTYEDAVAAVEAKGGKLLTSKDEFISVSKTRLLVLCQNGHHWETVFDTIYNKNHWCLECSHISYEQVCKLAEKRHGALLTPRDEFDRAYTTTLHWMCDKLHIWSAKYPDIKDGHWCGQCHSSLGEKACRAILEFVYKKPFNKIRPVWLDRLELDGYNPELGIAFEYNGQQHYKKSNSWHESEEKFLAQQERDRRKAEICKERGILLLVIPYTVKYKDLYDYIVFKLLPIERLPEWGVYYRLDYSLLKF